MAPVGLDTLAASAAVFAAREAATHENIKATNVLNGTSETVVSIPHCGAPNDKTCENSTSSVQPNKKRRKVEFPTGALLDLSGSSSAQVRRMDEDERALVHYKRRLRNRESAKRSRARRQATISELSIEIKELREETAYFAEIIHRQALELSTAKKERSLYLSMLLSESKNAKER